VTPIEEFQFEATADESTSIDAMAPPIGEIQFEATADESMDTDAILTPDENLTVDLSDLWASDADSADDFAAVAEATEIPLDVESVAAGDDTVALDLGEWEAVADEESVAVDHDDAYGDAAEIDLDDTAGQPLFAEETDESTAEAPDAPEVGVPTEHAASGISKRAAKKAAKRAARIAERIAAEESARQSAAEAAASDAGEVIAEPLMTADASAAPADTQPVAATDDAESAQRGPVDVDPPGALDLPDIDLDLLDIFVEEGVDILDHADGMMARLREAPGDREPVASLQRDLHTLKGGARMAGLFPIGDLSHAMESLFEAIVHGERDASRPAIEALERAFDRLHGMVQRVRARQAIGLPEHTIARLEAILEGREDEYLAAYADSHGLVAPAESTQPASAETPLAADVAADASGAEAEEAKTAPVRKIIPARPSSRTGVQRRTQLDDDEVAARAAQQELIRVRADLLDNLVNFAGEVSIYRSRLEAQMGGFRFNLVEFEQTVLRLREQLRKLEMETEAQILSRFQRESEQSGNTEFDPLELDRFSTLQQLSRALAESVSDLVSIQNLLDDIARQSETLLLQQSRVSSDLQEGLMRTRMVPFESLVPRLRRILRQTAAELGKKAQLKVEGTQGEMDRTVLERMTAPFEHMLRNSLAHGIESPEARLASGKPEEGTVSIRVSREATEVLIQVIDDGVGMNRDAIRRKAVERGLMTPEVQLSDRDIFQFVLEAGFSTASVVSKVAGRGVGMDVVASEVKQLGGTLELDSDPGQGTRITIRLPFTLAVAQAVMVKLGDATYAIPMSSITGVTRMPRKELDRRLEQKQLDVVYGGEVYQIYDLGELLRSPVSHGIDESQVPLLMSKTGDQRAAVRVTTVVGSKEVVVKSAGLQLSIVPGIFGATIMGDGRVVVILDLAPLVRHGVALRQAPELAAELDLLEPLPEPAARRQPLVMVVDDSITMRKVTTRVLERSNFDVFTAKDGLDAVEQLQDRMPDVILLDIEMPRMDGYEVATYIRNDQRLKHIPIIMITSRTGEKHRQRALEVGVDRYLGKPYQETDLLKNVQDALTTGHVNVH
jgi:chemosensory pili system protein ChpA (sensor histidine kinase/response regulator)